MSERRVGLSSSCFYPLDGFEAVKRATLTGFDLLEVFLSTFSELEEPHLKAVRDWCSETGTKIVSVHPFTSSYEYMLFFSASRKRALESCEIYRKYFYAAASLGAKYVIFHGDKIKEPFCGMENYCDILCRVNDVAKSEGITLAHETVSVAHSCQPEFMRELIRLTGKGTVKFALDFKQIIRSGNSLSEMIDVLGNDIVHIHINDYAENQCRLPFAGDAGIEKYIDILEKNGYNGKYIIEVYNDNYRNDKEIFDSGRRLESYLKIGKEK